MSFLHSNLFTKHWLSKEGKGYGAMRSPLLERFGAKPKQKEGVAV
ncbi:MAG TPA: hypothetical protein V6C85_29685 [Allocoleopsis sp.]